MLLDIITRGMFTKLVVFKEHGRVYVSVRLTQSRKVRWFEAKQKNT